MRVLLTGATGYVGSAVAKALLAGGHAVTGLARHREKAAGLIERGLRFVTADIEDLAALREQARAHEAVIHCASKTQGDSGASEQRAAEALLAGARDGGSKIFILTSGVWVFGDTNGQWVDESSPTPSPFVLSAWRPALEKKVLEASSPALRTNVVRPGIVYGGKGGMPAMWLASAAKDKVVRVGGDGKNRWSYVHLEDLGALYRLVLERGTSGGLYHGTDDRAPTTDEVARALGKAAGVEELQRVPVAEARKQMGPFADALVLDQLVKSPASRKLGWTVKHPGIVGEAANVLAELRAS